LFVELCRITPCRCEQLLVPWQNDVAFHLRVCGWSSQAWTNEINSINQQMIMKIPIAIDLKSLHLATN